MAHLAVEIDEAPFLYDMPKTGKGQQKRRERLFKENPHCFWCGCKMAPSKDSDNPRACTLDHLDDRISETHSYDWMLRDGGRTVIACKECNDKRGREKQIALGIDELRKRSNRHGGQKDWTNRPFQILLGPTTPT